MLRHAWLLCLLAPSSSVVRRPPQWRRNNLVLGPHSDPNIHHKKDCDSNCSMRERSTSSNLFVKLLTHSRLQRDYSRMYKKRSNFGDVILSLSPLLISIKLSILTASRWKECKISSLLRATQAERFKRNKICSRYSKTKDFIWSIKKLKYKSNNIVECRLVSDKVLLVSHMETFFLKSILLNIKSSVF